MFPTRAGREGSDRDQGNRQEGDLDSDVERLRDDRLYLAIAAAVETATVMT